MERGRKSQLEKKRKKRKKEKKNTHRHHPINLILLKTYINYMTGQFTSELTTNFRAIN
jgi:hypothetical protein